MQYAIGLGSRRAVEIIKVSGGYVAVFAVDPPDTRGPGGELLTPGCKKPVIAQTAVFNELDELVTRIQEYMERVDDCCDDCLKRG